MSRNNVLGQITPRRDRRLALIARNRQRPLIALLRLHIHFDIQHDNRAQEPHALLRDCK